MSGSPVRVGGRPSGGPGRLMSGSLRAFGSGPTVTLCGHFVEPLDRAYLTGAASEDRSHRQSPWGTVMMDRFIVSSNGPLSGSVRAGGAKNSALKLMAACLLAEGRHVLCGVPHIIDVEIMADVLRSIGGRGTRVEGGAPGEPG